MASQIAWHGLDPAANLIELAPPAGEDLIPESVIESASPTSTERASRWCCGRGFSSAPARRSISGALPRAAHSAGALAGFDLAHSVGNTPLTLHDSDADFAVWCSYKYLNAGPGAIGGAFIHERHVDVRPRLSGWWGHDASTRFQMKPEFRAHAGAAGWAVSNPSIFASAPLVASLALFQEAGVERLREKSVELTGYLEFLLDRLGAAIQLITPRDPNARGCQLSFRIIGAGRGARSVPLAHRERRCLRLARAGCDSRIADPAVQLVRGRFPVLREAARGRWRRRADVSGVGHPDVRIIGAGMAGALLAVLLARRGLGVSLFDRRPDPRYSPPERGRSINLALAARGIRALEQAGVMRHVRPLLIEMRGRCIHDVSGQTRLLPYGWKPGEVIYSVGRAALTKVLIRRRALPERHDEFH